MKHLVLAISLLMFASQSSAEEPQVRNIEFTHVGIYVAGIQSKETKANGIDRNVYSNPRFVQSTRVVPAKIGVTFGFEFRISGVPDGAIVTVRKETRYPSPGAKPPGHSKRVPSDTEDLTETLNKSSAYYYTLEQPWELLPGRWVFQFWSGDRKLGEQAFTLVAK